MRKWLLLAAGTAAALLAQSNESHAAPREFDAVSIKPYVPQGAISEGCNPHNDPITLGLTGCTLKQLVQLAYDIKEYQLLAKGMAWIDTDRYVIQARSSTPSKESEMMNMLQPVLIARFHLSIRRETRQGSAWLLQVAGHGDKLKPASKTNQCGMVNLRENSIKADCLSMDDFAEVLQDVLKDRPVVNRTASNKESKYQFDLRYSVGLDSSEGPSIFAALPEQLGLTLKAGKAPVDTLVMSGAQRPLPN